jgi:hypothetical protein
VAISSSAIATGSSFVSKSQAAFARTFWTRGRKSFQKRQIDPFSSGKSW